MTDMREPFPGHPPPITTRPEGLLSLLGLQTNGRYPQHLAYDKLDAGVDLLRWYLESVATFKTGSILVTGSAFVSDSNLVVPAGEHWLVLQYHMESTAAAAAEQGVYLARANSSGGTIVALSDEVRRSTGTVMVRADGPGQFYLARPSVQLGIKQTIGAALTYNYTLRYVRLQT